MGNTQIVMRDVLPRSKARTIMQVMVRLFTTSTESNSKPDISIQAAEGVNPIILIDILEY